MRLRLVMALCLLLCTMVADHDERGGRLRPIWALEVPAPDPGAAQVMSGRIVVRSAHGFSAFDALTGRPRWRNWEPVGNVDDWTSTETVVVGAYHRHLPTTGLDFIAALDVATGRIRWRRDNMSEAGRWRRSAAPTRVVVAWDPSVKRLTGLAPGSGATLWSRPICGGCSLVASGSTGEQAVVVLRDGKAGHALFLDADTGEPHARRNLRTAQGLDLIVQPGLVGILHDMGISVFDGEGRSVAERRDCWAGCLMIRSGDRVVLSYRGTHPVVEGIDLASGTSLWTRETRPAYLALSATTSAVLATTSTAPLRFDRIDPVNGAASGPVSGPMSGQLLTGRDEQVYTSALLRSGGVPLLRVSRLGDARLGRWDAAPVNTWPDACALPLPAPLVAQPGRQDRPDSLRCTFADSDGATLSVSVRMVSRHAADAAQLFEGSSAAAGGVPLEETGDQAVMDQVPPKEITVRVGALLLEVTTGDERLRDRLVAVTRALAGRLANTEGTPWPRLPVPPEEYATLTSVPGTPVVVAERRSDPVRLGAFTLNGDMTYRRVADGFARVDGAPGTVSPDGRWSARVSDDYPRRGRDPVWITDRVSRRTLTVPTVKAPLGVTDAVWSTDGGRLLLTVYRNEGENNKAVGFVVVDLVRRRVTVSRVGSRVSIDGRFIWGSGPDEVLASQSDESEEEDDENEDDGKNVWLTAFTLDGRSRRELPGLRGRPIDLSNDSVSPSRRSLVTRCDRTPDHVCVADLKNGTVIGRVPLDPDDLIGWYDETHLIAWVDTGANVSQAQIVDFLGRGHRRLVEMNDPALSGDDLDLVLSPSALSTPGPRRTRDEAASQTRVSTAPMSLWKPFPRRPRRWKDVQGISPG
ncbi:outer membrane protein assembly factor BamB family protein [Streptosporangium sp. NPDC004631]